MALKILRLEEGASAVEARALEFMKFVSHPNLLTIFGIWYDESHLIVGLELAEGTLLDRLRQAIAQGQPGIPFPELIEYIGDAAKGIDFLNEPRHTLGGGSPVSVVHRDIKPQNLLLVGGGAKVADYGLARVLERSITGKSGGLTPAYAAPEFFGNSFAKESDQYSLAVSYCQLRSGILPYQGTPLQVMAGHLHRPPDLSMLPESERPVLTRALAKSPSQRWPSCRAFARELARHGPRSDIDRPEPDSASVLTNSIGIKLALVPAGRFLMGSPETEPGHRADESPRHWVTITEPFCMGIFPVTQAEYRAIMGVNPAEFNEARNGGPDFPVENVSWFEALELCRRLSARYEEKAAGRSYYLPTEAEWEYACRAGLQEPFATGRSLSPSQANFRSKRGDADPVCEPFFRQTSRVGSYPPNPFGLYDMHGNVSEWCADYYEEGYYRRGPDSDPLGPRSGGRRVFRGGNWNSEDRKCRSACRGKVLPHSCTPFVGFRVVMISERRGSRDSETRCSSAIHTP